jgi:hypothetical protein
LPSPEELEALDADWRSRHGNLAEYMNKQVEKRTGIRIPRGEQPNPKGARRWKADTHTPYLSLRKHAKTLTVSDAIFHTSRDWIAIKTAASSTQHGKYRRYAFQWGDLLPLVQTQDTAHGNPVTRDESALKRKYRMG